MSEIMWQKRKDRKKGYKDDQRYERFFTRNNEVGNLQSGKRDSLRRTW